MYVKQCEQLVTIIQVKKPRRSAVADYRMTLCQFTVSLVN